MLRTILSLGLLPVLASAVTYSPSAVSNKTFDYVIVGGGLAGLTVAGRLSENSAISVLVIEAGYDGRTDPRVYDVVYNYGQAFNSDLDWHYPTDQGKAIIAGKTLGGSTSINGAAWTRGTKAQYDAIASLQDPNDGASAGWNWDGMFNYMKKAEGFSSPNDDQKAKGANSIDSYHGFSGPVQVTFSDTMYAGPQQAAFASVFRDTFGLPLYKDLNGGTPNCVSYTPNTINWHDSDHRSSSATAYLSPVESQRTNWVTLLAQQVTKIDFSSSTALPRVATGVQFGTPDGKRYSVKARREVIIAAGAIGSPALLQLSGIGDATALANLGINTIVDLKTVGKNLQEQTMSALGAAGTNFDVGGDGPSNVIAFPNLDQLFGSQASAMATQIRNSISSWASSQAASALSAAALQKIFSIQAGLIIDQKAPLAEIFSDTGYPDKVGALAWNLLPFSRGTVAITSTNPFTKPSVKVNWFSVDFDLSAQVAATRMIRRVFQTGPLKNLVTKETTPGFSAVPNDATYGSEANWRTWIKSNFGAVSHPIATCAMMSRSLGGVVDAHLRVYDTKNLRVVDASVLPLQVSAHLSSTLYGIAERAADLIKTDQ